MTTEIKWDDSDDIVAVMIICPYLDKGAVMCKCKEETPMRRILNAYSIKRGSDPSDVLERTMFFYDGEMIAPAQWSQNIGEFGISCFGTIYCIDINKGGESDAITEHPTENNLSSSPFQVRVSCASFLRDTLWIQVRESTIAMDLFDQYVHSRNGSDQTLVETALVVAETTLFVCKGKLIRPSDWLKTVGQLGLNDKDIIHCIPRDCVNIHLGLRNAAAAA